MKKILCTTLAILLLVGIVPIQKAYATELDQSSYQETEYVESTTEETDFVENVSEENEAEYVEAETQYSEIEPEEEFTTVDDNESETDATVNDVTENDSTQSDELENTYSITTRAGVTKYNSIVAIQNRLRSYYGFTEVAADGVYGPATKNALIKAMQTEINTATLGSNPVAVDGWWGPASNTYCKSLRSYADVISGIDAIPNYGVNSYQYRMNWVVQATLYCRGYRDAQFDVDGYFGPATKQAVLHFQRDHAGCGVAADGVVYRATYQCLFNH